MSRLPFLLGGVLPTLAFAQIPTMPSDAEIDAAMRALHPAIEQAGRTKPLPARPVDVSPVAPIIVPDVRAAPPALPPSPTAPPMEVGRVRLPRSTASDTGLGSVPPHLLSAPDRPIDLDGLIHRYRDAARPTPFAKEAIHLFLSFSIPEPKLKALLADAAAVGATVYFRGGLDDQDLSLTRITKRLWSLRLTPFPSVQVSPPHFSRYKVEVVPTWVLALPGALQEDASGCAPPGTYASVSGDVKSQFALTLMTRKAAPDVARVAQAILDRGAR